MAFPTSPSNNQVHKEGNRAFVYDSTLGVWDQVKETDRTHNKADTTHFLAGAKFPSGHIINTYHDTITGAVSTSTSSTWTDTGLSVTLTSSYVNTKFYVNAYFITQTNGNMLHVGGKWGLARNGTDINAPAGDDFYLNNTYTRAWNLSMYAGISFVDTPNAAAGTFLNYKLRMMARGTNPVIKTGHNGSDSFLTVFEIMP